MQDIVIAGVVGSLIASFASLIATFRQLRKQRDASAKDRHEFRITIVNEKGEPVLSTEFAGSEEDVRRLGRQVTRAQESA